jgi:hypothetical protein
MSIIQVFFVGTYIPASVVTCWDAEGVNSSKSCDPRQAWFVGPLVFYHFHPTGKPADNSPGGEPYNEIYQVHLLSPTKRNTFKSGATQEVPGGFE